MIISTKFKFAFLCMPKCASTSTESMLWPYAQISTGGDPRLKHLNLRKYELFFKPLLETVYRSKPRSVEAIEVVCLFREPIDWVNSWYRYRTREKLRNAKSTASMSFEAFAHEYVLPRPRLFARIGRQINFVKGRNGQTGRVKIFRYENYDKFLDYMSEKVGEKLTAPHLNVSPGTTESVAEKPSFLLDFLKEEYELYERL